MYEKTTKIKTATVLICKCQPMKPKTFFEKSYRCPKFDSYAMQTLEIRVEQKGIFDETDNEFSKTRQIEVSFPKTKREKKSKKCFSNFFVDCKVSLEEDAEIRRNESDSGLLNFYAKNRFSNTSIETFRVWITC